jgi:hypothetical protein
MMRAAGGERVLFIGPGVTLGDHGTGPIQLERRELGTYRTQSTLAGTRAMRESFCAWLDEVFAGVFGDFRPRDVLASCAQMRFFDVERLDQAVLFTEIFMRHEHDEIIVVSPDAWERSVTRALRGESSAQRSRARLALRFASRARLAAMALAGVAATTASIVRDELHGQASRRASFASLSHRRLWVVLASDYVRHNRHVIEAATREVDAADLGVLVFPPLEPGEIVEPEAIRRPSATKWSGLVELGRQLDDNAFALSIWGRSTRTLAAGLWASGLASGRVVWRIARSEKDIPLGQMTLPIGEVASSLARLCTIDVARARRTLDAANDLVKRTDVAGSTILFSHSNTAEAAPLHLVLRDAGAVTVDYFHGWTMEATPIVSESPATLRLVWSNTDAESVTPDQKVAVLVRRHEARPEVRASRVPRKVILLTNYAHRDLPVRERPYRMLLQSELLDAASELKRRNPQLELRWRPHPADLRPLVEPEAQARQLPLSAIALGEDLAWADIAVCSISTTILSALRSGLPTFVHVPPESQQAMSWVPRERSFFYRPELVSRLEAFLSVASSSSEAAGQPEQQMWDAHFGGPLVTTLGEVLESSERTASMAPRR